MVNGEGVARGMIQENEQRSDRVEEIDGIELGSRKRNRREACPVCWIHTCSIEAIIYSHSFEKTFCDNRYNEMKPRGRVSTC